MIVRISIIFKIIVMSNYFIICIASTISSDPESAEEMVVKLSELYRGVLKSAKEEDLVELFAPLFQGYVSGFWITFSCKLAPYWF